MLLFIHVVCVANVHYWNDAVAPSQCHSAFGRIDGKCFVNWNTKCKSQTSDELKTTEKTL